MINKIKNQSGNILFLILIAVALFAALSYAVISSTRSGSGNGNKEKADIAASEMVEYGTAIRTAIMRMMMTQDCTENQISFDNPFDPAGRYTNPNAPVDNHCHVFHVKGGGVSWKKMASSYNYDSNYGGYKFQTANSGADYSIANFGTSKHDLYLTVRHRSDLTNYKNFLEVCKAVNQKQGIADVPGNYENLPSFYIGAFGTAYTGDFVENTTTTLNGASMIHYPSFCVTQQNGYIAFITPLLVR